MYEEKSRKNININWKSLLIKMVILLVALFIIIWIVSLFNKKDNKENESNIKENLQAMKIAADEYFVGSRLPEKINSKKKITLGEMFDSKLLIEFKDQDNKDCDTALSYAEVTKVDEENYTIKVKLVCGAKSDYVINTKTVENNNVDDNNSNNIDDNNVNDNNNTNDNTNNNIDNNNSNNQNNSNNTISKPNTTNNNKKPTVSVNTNTSKPNNSNTSKPSTTTKPNTSSKPSTNTCKYGSKEYYSYYPVAYVISGDCAISYSELYNSKYANEATEIIVREYKKLSNEISELAKKTNTSLYAEQLPVQAVYNKANTGVVGFQVRFVAKQRLSTYGAKVIYEYYLDQNGNRKVIIDNRSGVTKNQGTLTNNTTNNNTNTNNVVRVNSVSLSVRDALNLYVGTTYRLTATINPNNATNKVVKWTSNDNSVVTVSRSGEVTAKRRGSAIVTATVDGKSASVRVYVEEKIKDYFELTRDYITMDDGETYRVGFDSNITSNYRDIKWSSSNSKVATVNSNGVITAKGSGKATITGRINGISSSIVVTVLEDSYIDILSDESVTVFVGEKHYIKVDTNIEDLKYKSSDTKIATVTYNGIVTAKKTGWVTITISGNGISRNVRIYCAETAFIQDSWVD